MCEPQDLQDRSDEVEALEAIFSDDFRRIDEDTFEITVNANLFIRIYFPESYPSKCSPLQELHGQHLTDEQLGMLSDQLDQIAATSRGEVIVFKWMEFLREHAPSSATLDTDAQPSIREPSPPPISNYKDHEDYADHASEATTATDHSAKQTGPANTAAFEKWTTCIISGDILVDRKSTFQAHLAPVSSAKDVAELLAVLKSNNKIARATHNIMAYRIVHSQASVVSDCDDDGESAAGGRLLHLLSILDVKNVCVVVSRWYGGIQLGPDRFKHINNVARSLLAARGYVATAGDAAGDAGKRRR